MKSKKKKIKEELKELLSLYDRYTAIGLNEKEYRRMMELVEKFYRNYKN